MTKLLPRSRKYCDISPLRLIFTSFVRVLIIAGHDTTAATLSWILYELAKDTASQSKLRQEIRQFRAKKSGDTTFSPADYDNMPYLNAVIKEGLRLYPILPTLYRMAGRDDAIPLQEPVRTKDGRLVNEIPVSKGQTLICSFATYNRLTSVWGDDADSWRPERFISAEKHQVNVGIIANLMSFSAGLQGCIGWKFSYVFAVSACILLTFFFSFSGTLKCKPS
jgi:cytochrome P450